MRVVDLVRSRQEVYSIREETTAPDAARYRRDQKVRSVGGRDAAGKLAGVESQSDISDKAEAENKRPAWMRVSEIKSRDLLVARAGISAGGMPAPDGKSRGRSLAGGGRIGGVGMISVADLLQVIASDHKARAGMFELFVFLQR